MIQFRQLTLNYRWESYVRSIFKDLDLCIPRGAFVSITGGNGSGKSSLLKLILGLVTPDAGEIIINGASIRPGYAEGMQENRIAYLAQRIETLFFGDTVEQELNFLSEEGAALAKEILDRMELAQLRDRDIDTLSGGERQGIALVHFLASQAPLLILDEPSSYLDRQAANILELELKKVHEAGKTILHATQFDHEIRWGSHHLDLNDPSMELCPV